MLNVLDYSRQCNFIRIGTLYSVVHVVMDYNALRHNKIYNLSVTVTIVTRSGGHLLEEVHTFMNTCHGPERIIGIVIETVV